MLQNVHSPGMSAPLDFRIDWKPRFMRCLGAWLSTLSNRYRSTLRSLTNICKYNYTRLIRRFAAHRTRFSLDLENRSNQHTLYAILEKVGILMNRTPIWRQGEVSIICT